jgi:site-specific recombinase XerD
MTTRGPLPNTLQRALDRIDRLIADHPALVVDEEASLLAGYLGYCRDELLFTPWSLRQQYYHLRYVQRWFRAEGLAFPDVDGPRTLRAFLDFQRAERGNSLIQLRHYLDTFRRLFAWLLHQGVIPTDPTATISLRTPPIRNVRDVLGRSELLRLLQAARDDRDEAPPRFHLARTRDAALIGLLAGTGCRLAEALALTRAHIDLNAGFVFLPGKGDLRYAVKERVVPMIDPLIRGDLERWLSLVPLPPDTPVFTTPSGQIVEPHSVQERLRRLARSAGISRRVTPHGLRATFASLLVANGIDPVALQQLMGHSRLSTTLTLYARLDTGSLHDAWLRHNPLAEPTDG